MQDVLKSRLQGLAAAAAEGAGAHLLDLLVRGDPGRKVIEAFIDAPGGVTADLCSMVSRAMTASIDGENILEANYRLDVSSPGIDRPLQFVWQYARHVGRTLEVKRAEGAPGISGKLLSVDEQTLVLRVSKENDDVTIPIAEIVEARVKAPW